MIVMVFTILDPSVQGTTSSNVRDAFRLKKIVSNWTFCLGGRGGQPQSKWFGTLFNKMPLKDTKVTKCPKRGPNSLSQNIFHLKWNREPL